MKKRLSLFLLLLGAVASVALATPPNNPKMPTLGDAPTNWPEVHYQISFIQRIPPNRLLVGVRLYATPKAPPNGTLIGFRIPIPPNADPKAIAAGYYHPRPLTLQGSTMTDDLTQQTYPDLPPIAPPGRAYLPGLVLGDLKPNHNLMMTIQFALPPPPPPGQALVKPTVSFLFTNATGPIKGIPLPPPN